MTQYKKEPTYKNRTSSINTEEYPIEKFYIKDLIAFTSPRISDEKIEDKKNN